MLLDRFKLPRHLTTAQLAESNVIMGDPALDQTARSNETRRCLLGSGQK